MPVNKNAVMRYRVIDKILQPRIPLPFEEFRTRLNNYLVEASVIIKGQEISLRQIQYDLAEMKRERPIGYGAPIVRKNGMIFYSDSTYSLLGIDLSEAEMTNLANLFSIYENYWSFPQVSGVRSFIKEYSNIDTDTVLVKELVEFNINRETTGLNKLNELIEIVMKKKQVIIEYQPFNKDIIKYAVDPLFLKEFNNRWFLITYDQQKKWYTTLGLERIINIKLLPNSIDESKRNEYKSKLKFAIGVSLPNVNVDPLKVKLKISPLFKYYLETKPLHFTQKIYSINNLWYAEFLLVLNRELEAEILRWGKEITVIEPQQLIDNIKSNLELNISNYSF